MAGWIGAGGLPPWGEDSREAELRWLATMSLEEGERLAEQAAQNLDCGAWEGVSTPNGGWVEQDAERNVWHAVAADFVRRRAVGERSLTEGMLAFATYDLACELAHLRGWCASPVASA
jgi:hypothetical protein